MSAQNVFTFCCDAFFPINILLFFFILEEFRKKQKKSNLSANLQYFMETSCKATDSDTLKVWKMISNCMLVTTNWNIFNCLWMSHWMSHICMSTKQKKTVCHMVKSVQRTKCPCSLSLRSSGTIQGGSQGIKETSPRRQPRSKSLYSQRRSSSNSRKSTLAGPTRRIIKMHQSF